MAEKIPAAVRAQIAERAGHRCEYCLLHSDDAGFPHQIDHVVSRKHGGLSSVGNLALACVLCNRNKGSDIASISRAGKTVRFFHPRLDRWADHFRISGAVIEPLTEIGEVTARALKLNAQERVIERRLLQALGRYPS